jgi:hypothetical protein
MFSERIKNSLRELPLLFSKGLPGWAFYALILFLGELIYRGMSWAAIGSFLGEAEAASFFSMGTFAFLKSHQYHPTLILMLLVPGLFFMLFAGLASAGAYVYVASALKGVFLSAGDFIRQGLSRFRAAFYVGLVEGSLLLLMLPAIGLLGLMHKVNMSFGAAMASFLAWFLLFFVFTIYFLGRFSLALPVVAVENTGALQSLRRSFGLTRGNILVVLAFFFLLWLSKTFIHLFLSPMWHVLQTIDGEAGRYVAHLLKKTIESLFDFGLMGLCTALYFQIASPPPSSAETA